jgi:hypothetical protein
MGREIIDRIKATQCCDPAIDGVLGAALEEILDLNNHVACLEQDRDELEIWVEDLQSEKYVNCVYCGHRYGPALCEKCDGSGMEKIRPDHMPDEICTWCNGTGRGAPVAMADMLTAHVERCPKHPLALMRKALDEVGLMAKNAVERKNINPITALEEIAFRSRKFVSPGVCVVEPCGWLENWDREGDETHDQYHKRQRG